MSGGHNGQTQTTVLHTLNFPLFVVCVAPEWIKVCITFTWPFSLPLVSSDAAWTPSVLRSSNDIVAMTFSISEKSINATVYA